MRISGVTHPLGAPVVTFTVAHGAHPRVTMFDHGYLPVRPLAASLSDGEIVFTWLVREVVAADHRPPERHTVYVAPLGEEPVRHQRIGAYAIVLSQRGILGTVNSIATPAPGSWALPGGGVDAGRGRLGLRLIGARGAALPLNALGHGSSWFDQTAYRGSPGRPDSRRLRTMGWFHHSSRWRNQPIVARGSRTAGRLNQRNRPLNRRGRFFRFNGLSPPGSAEPTEPSPEPEEPSPTTRRRPGISRATHLYPVHSARVAS